MISSFPSPENFLDRQSIKNKDGKEVPYAPIRFKQIVKERYLISKNMHTSYNDVGSITPTERKYLLEFLIEEAEAKNKATEEQIKKLQTNKK